MINDINDSSSVKVSGFDLIIDNKIIEQGVIDVILNNKDIYLSSGKKVDINTIASAALAAEGSGLDTAYLEDMLNFKYPTSTPESMLSEDDIEALKKEYENKFDKLKELLKVLEEEKSTAISDSESKLSEFQKELEQALKEKEDSEALVNNLVSTLDAIANEEDSDDLAEKLREEVLNDNTSDIASQTVPKQTPPPKTGDGDSSSKKPIELPIINSESKAKLFVSGALDKSSDTGKSGDNITSLTKPTFSGLTLPNTNVNLSIGGIIYTTTSDDLGVWKIDIPNTLKNDEYSVTITATSSDGSSETITSSITIDNTMPEIVELSWVNPGASSESLVNISKPTLTGIATPGSVISLTIGSNTYNTLVAEDGSWSIVVTSPLTDGDWDYSLKVSTTAGNSSSIGGNITVDTSVSTSFFLMDEATDSGQKGDFITNSSSPSFTGITEPYSKITLKIAGHSYQVTSNSEGEWFVELSNLLSEGTYDLSVIITDPAGNILEQSTTVLIDKTSPEVNVSITSGEEELPNNGHTNKDISLSGSTEPNSTVFLTINNKTIEIPVDTSGNWFFEPGILPDGNYNYSVVSVDKAGNSSQTISGSFTVDTAPPTLPTASLSVESDTGVKGDNITKVVTPTLSGTGEPGSVIVLTINNKTYKSVVQLNGTWSILLDALPDGTYSYSYYSEDLAGNKTVEIQGQAITVDTALPILTAGLDEASDVGHSANDGITKVKNLTFVGTALPGATVILTINGRSYEAEVTDEGTWSIDLPELGEGTYSYSVSTTDAAGNSKIIEDNVTIDTSVVNTAGLSESSDTGTSQSDGITKSERPTLIGKTDPFAKIVVTVFGKSYPLTADKDGNWTLPYPDALPDLEDGNYEYTVEVEDVAGNTNTLSNGVITVDNSLEITTGLASSSQHPDSANPTFTHLSRPLLTGNSEPGAIITIIVNGVRYPANVDETGKWTFTFPTNLSPGLTTYIVEGVDIAGNRDTISSTVNYVPDGVELPTVEISLEESSDTGHSKNDNITKDKTPTFIGTVSPISANVILTINGVDYRITPNAAGNFRFELPTELTDGYHNYKITVVSPSGISTEKSGIVTIDSMLSRPEIQLSGVDGDIDDPNDFYFHNRTFVFSGKTEPGTKVQLIHNGYSYNVVADQNGNYTFNSIWNYANTAPYTIKFEDVAGNKYEQSGTIHTQWPATDTTLSSQDIYIDNGFWHFTDRTPIIALKGNFKYKLEFLGEYNAQNGGWIEGYGNSIEIPAHLIGHWTEGTIKITLVDKSGRETIIQHKYRANLQEISITEDEPTFNENQLISLSGTLQTPPWSAVKIINAQIQIDGNTYPITVTKTANGQFSWTFQYPNNAPELPTGLVEYTLTFEDNFGHTQSKSGEVYNLTTTVEIETTSDSGAFGDFLTKEKSPTFVGVVSKGATVRIKIAGVFYDATVDNNGNWTFTVPNELGQGLHRIEVVVAYEGQTKTFTQDFTIDSSIDPSTSGLSEIEGQNSELSIVSLARPVFTGRTEPNVTVTLTINGVSYSVESDAEGFFSVTPSNNIAPGTYQYTITFTDDAGNSTQNDGSVQIEPKPPLSIKYNFGPNFSETDDYLTNDGHFKGTGTPGYNVAISYNGVTLNTTILLDGTWSIDASSLFSNTSDGAEYQNVVISTTSPHTGNKTDISFDVVFDTTPPSVTFELSDDSLSGTSNTVTNKSQITLQGTTKAFAKLTIVIGDITYTVFADANGHWSAPLNKNNFTDEGEYNFSITSTDRNGIVSNPTLGSFVIDDTGPVVSYTHEFEDTNVTDDSITKSKDHVFSGVVSNGETVSITINGIKHDVIIDPSGNWLLNLENLIDGQYTYTITVTDIAGNKTERSGKFIVDNELQNATYKLNELSDSGLVGDNTTNVVNPTFVGTAEPGSTVELTINGKTYTTTSKKDGSWQITVTDNLPEGSHDYDIIITDIAGNVDSFDDSITINTTPSDAIAVTVGLSPQSAPNPELDNTSDSSRPIFVGTASPNTSLLVIVGEKSYKVTTNSEGEWHLSLDIPLADGDYRISVKAFDHVGNIIGQVEDSFTVDTQTTITLEGIYANDELATSSNHINDSTPTFKGQGEPGSTVEITINGKTHSVIVDNSGNWLLTIDALPDTTYDYTITITDKVGNQDKIEGELTIDTQSPSYITASLDQDSLVAGTTNVTTSKNPIFSGSTEPGATVTLMINGKTLTTKADASGRWTVEYEENDLTSDSYDYVVSVKDTAGNVTETPLSGSITVDITKPSAESSLSASSNSGSNEDNITSNVRPTIVGSTKPGSTIILTFGGVDYPVQANADGSWSFIPPFNLEDGTYNYTVSITDKHGLSNQNSSSI
ncbi:Ig-like domain-containing protein, partial [Vibrio scophthalmi]|uniref:Ig-like domain-containing protein n=1 Tax=Vibrio scophthalmi TaxID=45658 RepID=UPI000592D7DF